MILQILLATVISSMDICLNTDKLASEDLNNYYELVVDPAQLICGFSGELPVNDLGKDLTKLLNLEDGENSVSGSIPASGNDGVGEVPICEDFQFSKSTNEKVLKRSATFPCSNNGMSPTAALTCENEEKTEDRVDNIPSEVLEQNGHVTSDATPSRSLSLPVSIYYKCRIKLLSMLDASTMSWSFFFHWFGFWRVHVIVLCFALYSLLCIILF